MATFKRARRRVISAAAPLGKATGFCVTREAPGRFGRKVSTGFGPAREYSSPYVFGGLVKIRDKGGHSAEKRYSVRLLKVSPGRSTVDGNSGWFGESG